MSCETIETLLQESLLVLNHIEKYDEYLEYLHSEWLYTVNDLKLAFTNEATYLNLKIPARLKLELVALLNATESAKIDESEDAEEKDDYSFPAVDVNSGNLETSKEWVSCYSTEYECYYYYNTMTYESSWECPDPTLHYEYVEYIPSEGNASADDYNTSSTVSESKSFSKPKSSEAKSSIFKASPKHTEIPDTPPVVRTVNNKLLPKYADSKAVGGKTIFDNSSSDEDDADAIESRAAVSRRDAEEVGRSSGNAKSSPRSPVSSGSGSSKLKSNGHTVIYNKGAVVVGSGEDPFSTTRSMANSGRKAKQQQQSQTISESAIPPVLAVAVPVPSRGIFDIDDTEEEISSKSSSRPGGDPRAQYVNERETEFNDSFYMATVGGGGDSVKAPPAKQQQQPRKHQPSTAYPQRQSTSAIEGQQEVYMAPAGSEGPAALSGYAGYNSKLRNKPSPREGDAKSEEVSPRSGPPSYGSNSGRSTKSGGDPHFTTHQQQDRKGPSSDVSSLRSDSTRSNTATRTTASHNNSIGSKFANGARSASVNTGGYSSSSGDDEEQREVTVRAGRRDLPGYSVASAPPPKAASAAHQSVLPSAPPAEPIANSLYHSPPSSKHSGSSYHDHIERITPPPHLESPLAAAIRTSPDRANRPSGGLNSYIVTDENETVNYLDLAMEGAGGGSDNEEELPPRPIPQEGVVSPPGSMEDHKPKKKSGIKKHFNKLLNLFGGGSNAGKKYKGNDPKVAQLIAMGFDEQEAMYALTMCDRDVGLSCKMLRHKDEEVENDDEEQEEDGADHSSEPYR